MTRDVNLPVSFVFQIVPSFLDQNSNIVISSDHITYSSTDSAIATVDANGLLTAVAVGTCSINASSSTLNATLNITVYVPVLTFLSI